MEPQGLAAEEFWGLGVSAGMFPLMLTVLYGEYQSRHYNPY